MPPFDKQQHDLYIASQLAYADYMAAKAKQPKPGTPEWEQLQEAKRKCTEAVDDYLWQRAKTELFGCQD